MWVLSTQMTTYQGYAPPSLLDSVPQYKNETPRLEGFRFFLKSNKTKKHDGKDIFSFSLLYVFESSRYEFYRPLARRTALAHSLARSSLRFVKPVA